MKLRIAQLIPFARSSGKEPNMCMRVSGNRCITFTFDEVDINVLDLEEYR